MRWPPWASNTPQQQSDNEPHNASSSIFSSFSSSTPSNQNDENKHTNILDWRAFTEPRTLLPTAILTTAILSIVHFRRRYLRRFPDAISISPKYLRQRSLLGQVTSVGDGDNFRIFHTPGGRLAGWGWLPWKKVPTLRKELRDNTIHVRLAGIDAPELPHFGRPEQPFAREAHTWLTSYLMNRRVRVYIHRHDQYQRAVGSVCVRRALDFPIPFRRRDVSYEMLKRGLATVYEAKVGAEFGGEEMERKYRKAEWWAKLRGKLESPREYKTRMGTLGAGGNGNGNGNGGKN
ncbi:nuclease domain protein [Aspergillus campestris IBT 28561]|uniref:Probable endonuclease LCL3 n=1 Tax=Aspergillus campestris (strain IBT 28561) TaxID=1392248 RepID=A0A2I1D4N9_ASPC2|nr:nuclease domain protein [Aspergillus campestris IBT 28561]PKY04842.1 nuclease domain protein [Aspergillus campestris IBT 28561]